MTLGVSSVGGGADQLLRFLAKQAKLDPDRDMTISALGSGDAMIAALSRGRSTASSCRRRTARKRSASTARIR